MKCISYMVLTCFQIPGGIFLTQSASISSNLIVCCAQIESIDIHVIM